MFWHKRLDEATLSSLKSALIDADLGLSLTDEAMAHLQTVCAQGVDEDATLLETLKAFLRGFFQPVKPLSESLMPVVLVVGINGAGKTTSIAKLARYYGEQGHKVALASGDTYRAAADEQLNYWADAVGAVFINRPDTQDPAAVMYDAYGTAKQAGATLLIADTAGRMHGQQGLMDQLKKVKRVLGKLDAKAPHEVWLVLDGSLGQSNVTQAQLFHEALGVTGVVLTKMDGSAKGGALFSVAKMGLPIRFLGSGESSEDLQLFDPKVFVDEVFA